MVRAAVSGAVDYSLADPTDPTWRLRHRLLITEVQRKEEQGLADYLHRHYCAYLAHGSLNADSFQRIKAATATALTDLQAVVFPWAAQDKPTAEEIAKKEATIDPATQRLIDAYKALPQPDGNEK